MNTITIKNNQTGEEVTYEEIAKDVVIPDFIHADNICNMGYKTYIKQKPADKLEFTEKQKDTIKQVANLIETFSCNEGNILDCSDKCPFKIKGENASHKYSSGCLHKKLLVLLQAIAKSDEIIGTK